MTASTATASAALAWQTNLSDEQRGMVKFVADTCENQSSEEIVAWLEDLNWDMSVINVKLDRVTRGEENFQSGWHQPTRKKKKTKHSTSESTSTNATSQSKKQRNSVKATPPRESTKKPRKNDRKQTRDRQNEPKSTGGGRRSERKRSKKQNYQPQFREKEGSTAQPIQSASGIVSGDSSYADRAKPDGGTSVQESQSSASTPSISSRTPSGAQYARPFQPNQAEGGNYGTPHRKRERNGRRKPNSPSNEREEPHEPREHRSRTGALWDRYNQYSHPDEIPPRHSAGRRGGRHVNGATRNKYQNHHYMNGNQSYPAQTYRPATRPPDENSTRRRERHKQEPYQDGKLESAVKQHVKMNGTARPEVYRESERKPISNYPTGTLDVTTVNSNPLSSQPHLTLQQSSERDELETLSDKSDRSTTNMPNTIRIAPAVTPTQPAFPFGGPFSSEFKQTLQPQAQSEREMSDLKPSAGPPVITKATLSIPSSTITDPAPKHANGPTRPPMPRVGSAGVSSFANEKSYPVRQPGGMDGRIMQREDIVSSEKQKGVVVLPQVFHEVKDMEPSEYGFGRPTDDFGATETATLPAQTVLFVRDLEGRMERDDVKFNGIIGIPHDIVSQAELELKTEEELVELFAQFVRPAVPIPSAPQSATPIQPVVTERNSTPVVEEVPASVQQQAPPQPPTQPEQNASVVGTPTTSSIKSGAATGSAGATTEKTDQFNGQAQSGLVVFGRRSSDAAQPRPHGPTFGNSSGSRGFERKTPDSHSPEQYTAPPVHNATVAVQPQIPSDGHIPPVVFNATTVQMNRMPSNGSSAPYSPNMMAAQMGGTQPNMVFHAMPAGGSALMSSGFGMGAQNGQLGHPQQQVVPSGVPNMAQPPQHQGMPQVHHLHNTHFGGPSHPQFQMPRQHSHPGMPHAHIPHGAHPPGHQGPMPGQFPVPMQEDDRYHMPGQMMQMDFHPRFQAQAPPPPPQHTQGGFMHQLPQGNMGMHPPGPPPNVNGQLPPQAAPQAAPAFNGHLPPPLGGGMGHGPPPGHFGHGPAAPMFPQPTAHPPPMTQPPQQMIGHSMGPQHPPPMFDQPQQHYRSEFVPNSYTQNQPQQWAGSFEHQY